MIKGIIMKKVFIDLEMNPIKPVKLSSGETLKREIIEIGAVMLDECNNEISFFKEYVRPTLKEELASKIIKLTGISNEIVASADTFPSVLERFINWCDEDYEVYSWSASDLNQMKMESQQKMIAIDLEASLFSRWNDYQIQFMEKFGFERLMSLATAIDIAGLDFQGRAHGALADARNTANLYKKSKEESFIKMIKDFHAESQGLSVNLGSLFDFSQLAG